jgi:hypothetical protein
MIANSLTGEEVRAMPIIGIKLTKWGIKLANL